jgi:hypothetical protein
MSETVSSYFTSTVFPLVDAHLPGLSERMTVQVIGSYGLGIADSLSDLDAVVYLPDPVWETSGRQLQLLLEKHLPPFGAPTTHPGVVVWPRRWLGKLVAFLDDTPPPWEEETVERLHQAQHCLIVRDPEGILERLRVATSPSRVPEWLWRKRIIGLLRELHKDDLPEYAQTVARGNMVEQTILLGGMLKKVMHLGFHIARQYYPWRTHLRWAFGQLPAPAADVLNQVDLLGTDEVPANDKVSAIKTILAVYSGHITSHGLLPGIRLDGEDMPVHSELEWAMRFKAWNNPEWRSKVSEMQRQCALAGETPDKWWMWSLWD